MPLYSGLSEPPMSATLDLPAPMACNERLSTTLDSLRVILFNKVWRILCLPLTEDLLAVPAHEGSIKIEGSYQSMHLVRSPRVIITQSLEVASLRWKTGPRIDFTRQVKFCEAQPSDTPSKQLLECDIQ